MNLSTLRIMASATVLMLTAALVQVGIAGTAKPRGDDETKHEISAKELKVRLDQNQKIVILDARTHLNGQIIKGAVNVPEGKLADWAKTADKSAFIVTYCTCPHDEAAEEEMHELRDLGFLNAFSLTGGLDAAKSAGIAIASVSE